MLSLTTRMRCARLLNLVPSARRGDMIALSESNSQVAELKSLLALGATGGDDATSGTRASFDQLCPR